MTRLLIIIIIAIIWFSVGVFGFIFWWRMDDDYTTDEIVITVASGLLGPLAIGIFYLATREKRVLLKKKEPRS